MQADHNEELTSTSKIVMQFGACSVALCKILHGEKSLDETERLFIDNHLQVVSMAYMQWKRKQNRRSRTLSAVPPSVKLVGTPPLT